MIVVSLTSGLKLLPITNLTNSMRMKKKAVFAHLIRMLISCLFAVTSLEAQWKTQTLTLKEGLNAVYLWVDPSPEDIDSLLIAFPEITEVWKWNEGATTVMFGDSPSDPISSPDWLVWYRNDPGLTNLSLLNGDTAYLINVSGSSGDVVVNLTGRPVPPSYEWMGSSFNLTGFQVNDTVTPWDMEAFLGLSAELTSVNNVHKYGGGSPQALQQVIALRFEDVTLGSAYWIETSAPSSDFVGPLFIGLNGDGINFGSETLQSTIRVKNISNRKVRYTLRKIDSDAAPAGEAAVAGTIPLSLYQSDPENPVNQFLPFGDTPTDTFVRTIDESLEHNLSFAVRRANMGTAAGVYQTIIQMDVAVEDSPGSETYTEVTRHHIGVTAEPTRPEGLWMGTVTVNKVYRANVGHGRELRPFSVTEELSKTPDAEVEYFVEGYIVGAFDGSNYEIGGSFTTDAALLLAADAGETNPANTLVVQLAASDQNTWGLATNSSNLGQRVLFNGMLSRYVEDDLSTPLTHKSVSQIATYNPDTASETFGVYRPFTFNIAIHRDDLGNHRLLQRLLYTTKADQPALVADTSLVEAGQMSNSYRFSTSNLPVGGPWSATSGALAVNQILSFTVDLAHDDPTNPFIHTYHPDHDNLDARFESPLPAGQESFNVIRQLSLEFAEEPLPGIIDPSWGSTLMGGTFRETISGLHKKSIDVEGTFTLRKVSGIDTIELEP